MTVNKDLGFLGITLKDLVSYLMIIISAVIFMTNMNNRIDNLVQAVDRLNANYDKKDAVDVDQYKRIEANERLVLIIQEQLRLRNQ